MTNFEIQKYYQNEPKFNGVYSRNDLSKVKNWAYIINFDEYELIETHWIALYVNTGKFDNFDSFGAEPIPKEIKKFKENKISLKVFIEYKHTIRLFLDTFVLELLISC